MPRPDLELADIFRRHGPAYREGHRLPVHQLKVMQAIETCRTAALGGHVDQCDHCDFTRISYNSCRNRHCPKCQSLARAKWLEKRKAELLPVEYYHLVFTVPEQIASIAFQNKAVVYAILFRAAAETLLTIARDPKHLGAEIGFFGILHTWGQNLHHHPHIHFVVPGGGLSPDADRWVACRPGFFLPVQVLSRLFRRLFLERLEQAYRAGELKFYSDLQALQDPEASARYLDPVRQAEWVVYAKPPFGGPERVLEYLGRYTHRIAISNQRLVSMDDDEVCFLWKDYRNEHKQKQQTMRLPVSEFIRRFLMHTVPSRFPRIRYYGFLASANRKMALPLCRKLLAVPVLDLLPRPALDYKDWYEALTGESLRRCPQCGVGSLQRIETLQPCRPSPVPMVVDTS